MQYNLHFFNTNGLSGDQLAAAISSAKTQEEKVLFLFRINGVSMSPHEVHTKWIQYFDEVPLTSIRRAMSVLVSRHKLIKTDQLVQGKYGKPNYRWKTVD